MKKTTRNEEDYLKTMLHMIFAGESVATNSLAARLGISPPSVTSMVKKLMGKGFITYKKYGSISFTALGEKLALSLTRRHRLWEVFLFEKLNFSWDEVHEVAEELEHIRSEKLMNCLDEFLGFPKFDPHGDRIPSAELLFPLANGTALTDLPFGKSYKFSAVRDDSSEFLKDLNKLGLKLGMELKVISAKNNNINIEGSNFLKVSLPIKLARKVFVTSS